MSPAPATTSGSELVRVESVGGRRRGSRVASGDPAAELAVDGRARLACCGGCREEPASTRYRLQLCVVSVGASCRRCWRGISVTPRSSNSPKERRQLLEEALGPSRGLQLQHPSALSVWNGPTLVPPVHRLPELDAVGVGSRRHLHGSQASVGSHEIEVVHTWMTAVVVLINLQAQRRPRRITTKPSQRPGTVQAWWIMPIIHHGALGLSAGGGDQLASVGSRCRRLAVRRGRPRWWAVPAGKELECFGSRLRDVQGFWLG